jgi:hypothetical protein
MQFTSPPYTFNHCCPPCNSHLLPIPSITVVLHAIHISSLYLLNLLSSMQFTSPPYTFSTFCPPCNSHLSLYLLNLLSSMQFTSLPIPSQPFVLRAILSLFESVVARRHCNATHSFGCSQFSFGDRACNSNGKPFTFASKCDGCWPHRDAPGAQGGGDTIQRLRDERGVCCESGGGAGLRGSKPSKLAMP